MLEQIRKDAESKMYKSIELLKQELAKLRTGRAHPSILDAVKVDYYGQETALNQLASISVTDSRTLTVTPFDKSSINSIDKAIRNSDLGLNPATAGTTIRVPLPPLTEERRLSLIRQMKGTAEDAKVAIRNVRRDANNVIKNLLKDKQITEDEERRAQDGVQKVTDKYISDIDKMVHEKEADLLQV